MPNGTGNIVVNNSLLISGGCTYLKGDNKEPLRKHYWINKDTKTEAKDIPNCKS